MYLYLQNAPTSVHSRERIEPDGPHPRFPRFYFAIRFYATGHCYPADRLCMAARGLLTSTSDTGCQVAPVVRRHGHIGKTRSSCQAPITDNQFPRHLPTALIRAANAPFDGALETSRNGAT